MSRCWLPLSVVLLALAGRAPAADKSPAGNWKLLLPLSGDTAAFLIGLQEKDGAWTAKSLGSAIKDPTGDLVNIDITTASVKDNLLTLNVKLGSRRLTIEAKLPKDEAARAYGILFSSSTSQPIILEKTTLTSLDPIDVARDNIANSTDSVVIMRSAMELLDKSAAKAKPEEIRGWMAKALKAAEPFGERWRRDVLLDLTEKLNEQEGLAQVALPFAKQAERLLTPKDRPTLQKRTLDILVAALERAGKGDEAKEVAARIKKIDLGIQTHAYAGRPAKSNRVAVLELFTGAECPPCVAADLAFDALLKTFQPKDVIALQYHQHIPGADPLTTADSEARMKYYQDAYGRMVGGTPSVLVNGDVGPASGGGKQLAQDRYDALYEALVGRLGQEAKVGLSATAVRKGDTINIAAKVSDAKQFGKSVKLRLVLAEEEVEYKGGNGLERHHHVVRALPGGPEGVAVAAKDLEHKVSVDLNTLKKDVKKYLEDHYKKEMEELPKTLPMELKKLKVIALVQDDNTREVLNAIQVDVEDAK